MMKKRNPVFGIKTANILKLVCKTEDVGSSPAAMLFGSDFPSFDGIKLGCMSKVH